MTKFANRNWHDPNSPVPVCELQRVDFEDARTPDIHIFLVEKIRMVVFGQESGELSVFLH